VPQLPSRRQTTIVALDVAGYSALAEADEASAAAAVAGMRAVVEATVDKHGGRLFNTAGDGFMLEFASSADAVAAALELATACTPKVRVGVHLGDVFVQPNGDLLGHGVNVAARLMTHAAPGSALVSAEVRRTIGGALGGKLMPRGLVKLDKMAATIEAFATEGAGVATADHAIPVLAVLPFDNLSNDPEMQFFSDGVAEEILQVLANHSGLKVIGRMSAFQFRGAAKAGAAHALKATHVLDGAVRKSGARMRVTAQLTDVAGGTVLWGERFDREVAEAFAVQDDIAAKVAGALRQTLTPARHTARIDPLAYELYLKARPLASAWDPASTRRAVLLFDQVVAREPHFAEGWALLAAARAFLLPATRDALGDPDHAAALAAANRALALDQTCAEAYRALAMLKPAFAEHSEKVRLIETALAYAPDDPIIAHAAATAYSAVGRCRDALAIAERAKRAEPMSPFHAAIHANCLFDAGRADEAFAAIDEAWRQWPQVVSVWYMRWIFLTFGGRADQAERMTAEAALPEGMPAGAIEAMRGILALLRLDPHARRPALEAWFNANAGQLPLRLCELAAFAGHPDLAFERLFAALDAGGAVVTQPAQVAAPGIARAYTLADLFHFHSRALRRDVRFAKLCARVGLADYWRASGVWPDCAEDVAPLYDFKRACEEAARPA
jgi:adenylate cyclase